MATYSYEIVDRSGAISTGNIEAESENEAVERLRGMGYYITEIKEVKSSSFNQLQNLTPRKKVKLADLSMFSRQLASMLEAGIPLARSLATLSKQTTSPTLKKTIEEVADSVESGNSFSDSLSEHPRVFSNLYVGMVNSGEVGGNLEEALTRLSDQLDKDKALQDNIKSATFYPIMVVAFAFLILLAMMIFVVPIFVEMFPPDTVLPLPTRIVIAFSDSLRFFWYIWLLMGVLIAASVRYYIRSSTGGYFISRIKLKLPVFGDLFQKALVARFARTLATLLAGGLPVLQALESASQSSGSVILEEHVDAAKEQIQEGSNIADPLAESAMFPPMVIQMISIGEESGQLSSLLDRIADFYEKEVESLTKGLTAMLEPFLLVFIGVVVGGIVISLYLPIFTAITEVV
ncbi:type II secretion system F family protein [Natranaerofaba carboxydovora]|uniref:type II secretion system F family protein n=1 Tax=Natranaerofaba carboxydovora TaxID=2742683 RepID=UPI001F14823E|nr:type II secretion system F family protein [Natranaerofaba carboxydovora]UMZ73512.1 Type II secretion system protein F [Natranaerofaba carboxydovora]